MDRKNPVEWMSVLQLIGVCVAEVEGRGIAGEHGRRDHVHPFVGGLRGQDGGDQQLEWGREIEGAEVLGAAGVFHAQAGGRFPGAAFGGSGSGHDCSVGTAPANRALANRALDNRGLAISAD